MDSLEVWRNRSSYRLYEAALLMAGRDPVDWPREKLLSAPPADFSVGYGQMLIDAETITEKNVESQEFEGVYYDEYAFMTCQFREFAKLSDMGKLSAIVEKNELIRWLKANRKIPDKFFLNPAPITSPAPSVASYLTPWLKIQDAAIAQFFNPRKDLDAKKESVVNWIKDEAVKEGLRDSTNIAEAIFTIIKPIDHDPKKKRV